MGITSAVGDATIDVGDAVGVGVTDGDGESLGVSFLEQAAKSISIASKSGNIRFITHLVK
ncbi:hypothetical protein FACS1894217_15380 [Clostridia bacterium]|nr:hypothetical protein FACS1894217_15380 [Clostridia bacterium]